MFKDRTDAGRQLAEKLKAYKNDPDVIVFAIPRGGVVVADEICSKLNLPMDVVVTRKLGAPFNEELAIGAVDPLGEVALNQYAINMLRVGKDYIEQESRIKLQEVKERLKKYRGKDTYDDLTDKKVLLVDDGIATGYTVIAAINFLKGLNPKKIVLAVPVIAPDTLLQLKKLADEVVCIISEEPFYAVGQFYENFAQVSDEEVMEILSKYILPSPQDT